MARLWARLVCMGLLLAFLAHACQAQKTKLLGSGATTLGKLFGAVIPGLDAKHGVNIKYNAIGSGDGRKQFLNNTVQFVGTDVPMATREESQLRGAVKLTIPIALQTISVFTFIPQNTQGIKLSAPVLAKIFSRTIVTWDHPAILALNPSLRVPRGQSIFVVVRLDNSGSTSLFSQWLAQSAPGNWKLGVSGLLKWPQGVLKGTGSTGVAATMRASPFSIGYLGTSVGYGLGLNELFLRNKAGVWRRAARSDVYAAVPTELPPSSSSWAGVSLLDSRGKQAWPLTSFSYLLARRDARALKATGGLLKAFLNYLNSGTTQAILPKYQFFRLPQKIVTKNSAAIKTIVLANGVKVPF